MEKAEQKRQYADWTPISCKAPRLPLCLSFLQSPQQKRLNQLNTENPYAIVSF